ncbi:hypothetical protein FA13DRAFT_1799504 [Coprinellus micaceus]|uniref:F-box domain-containing protein n=1 Tax=Coprinellus micaceus TaxID=71717 RepID=A0A4Y7SIM9_COPMI|nr:hypothetical protein FA13DRAFT_1799504 [Coprinellus micaceus]
MISIEALNALQLATDCKPGALSPLLREFAWFQQEDAEHALGKVFSGRFPPYVSLFAGDSVSKLHRVCLEDSDSPLHLASIRATLRRLSPRLQSLALHGDATIEYSLQLTSWDLLEHLDVGSLYISMIPYLSLLPRLASLDITTVYPEASDTTPPTTKPTKGFFRLKKLIGSTGHLSDLDHFLRYLHPLNVLHSIKWHAWKPFRRHDFEAFLASVVRCCNTVALTSLEVQQMHPIEEEPMDMEGRVDISPLHMFKNFQRLSLLFSQTILVTPDTVTQIPLAWPNIRSLILSQYHSSSYTRLINHYHILELVSKLPHLQELGLSFDATQVTGQERAKVSFRTLNTLLLGDSPIVSPSRVTSFLKANFSGTGDPGYRLRFQKQGIEDDAEEVGGREGGVRPPVDRGGSKL